MAVVIAIPATHRVPVMIAVYIVLALVITVVMPVAMISVIVVIRKCRTARQS